MPNYPTEGPDLGRTPISVERDPTRTKQATCSCWPDELYDGCDLHGRAAQPDVWPRLDAIDADIAQATAGDAEDEDDACPNCGARDSRITADRVTCRRCGTEAMNA